MAPKSQWNKKSTLHTNNAQKAAITGDAASPAINYGEVQAEEVDVLQAIYMEDYEDVALNTSAWGKSTDHSFKLTIRPTSEYARPEDFVVLSVRLTATYPKSAPMLEIQGLEKFHERTQKRVRNVLGLRPQQMLGEVMIHTISTEIQEALDDAVSARAQGTLPSLDEERATAEEVALNLAKEAEQVETRRQQQAQQEEDRALTDMVNQEINRRENKRKSLKPSGDAPKLGSEQDLPDTIVFEQTAKIKVGNETETFTEVGVNGLLFAGPKESTYVGKPKVANSTGSPLVTIVRRKIEMDRSNIIKLESVLESAYKLEHPGLVNLLAFRVDRINNFNSELILCREYANRGSLYDLLSMSDLHTSKSRQFTVQLLETLEYLHSKGMVHGGVSTRSIYICTNPSLVPKLADFGYSGLLGIRKEDNPCKWRSPESNSDSLSSQRHTDLWDLGVVIVQMFIGLNVTEDYSSPSVFLSKFGLSEAFEDLLTKIFSSDAKKRPSCFDLLPAEFLRTEASVLQDAMPRSVHRTRKSSSGFASPLPRRSRHNSSTLHEPFSRYENDFTDLGRLGKGGFGEVVKARNKLDSGVYAVKKIRQSQALLEQVLKEVMLLNRLNHPYVVRYYSTWVENDISGSIQEDAVTTTEETVSEGPRVDFGYHSTGGLDFVSSGGFPGFEFADDDDDDDNDDDDNEFDDDPFERDSKSNGLDGTSTVESDEDIQAGNLRLNKSRSDSRRSISSTLYIQMELCDRRSLRDLIRRTMDEDDSWRIMRQITEGLAHIHANGIIHRDLKPDNVFIDNTGNPKIGDFGLATTGQYNAPDSQFGSKGQGSIDMTRSIGTALYVAPELQSNSGASYDGKVDMFSLGIMFFEMCQTFSTAMERINEIQRIRQKDHQLPPSFQMNGEKAAQGRLINCLISHKPSERPTSAKLLQSDFLPLKIEDETIRQALSGLSDPHSPYHQQLTSALFAHDAASTQRVKARAWEAKAATVPEEVDRVRMRGVARSSLETVFRRHGAEESRRDAIFPRSGIYTHPNVVQLLDASGNLLQLPYDMTLPHAQQLARQPASVRCTFTFGGAYRDTFTGGPPRVAEEADFDIVNAGRDDEIALNDAEVVKVMDEVVSELPTFESLANICFQLNHGKLLDAVLDHCRVPGKLQHVVKETLSKLGVHQNTWAKVRPELRNLGLSDTTLDDLSLFDWRDAPEKASNRLRSLFELGSRTKTKSDEAMQHIRRVFAFLDKFGLASKIYVAPLSCVNARFFENGILFQCMLEKKKNSVVIAAGGRYDSLIQTHRTPEIDTVKQGAVGITISMDFIVAQLLKTCTGRSKSNFLKDQSQQQHNQLPKRCDVLVIAIGTENLRDAGIKLVANLWAHDITAELSHGSFAEQSYTFIVNMRHETSHTVRVTNKVTTAEDIDVPVASLVSHLQQELRDQASSKVRRPLLRNHSSHQDSDRKAHNVHMLIAQHRSKKSNKWTVVEAAQNRWSEMLDQRKEAPILAIETRDEVLKVIGNTRLGDSESWRTAIHSVAPNERAYLGQVQEMLASWRKEWKEETGPREVGVYNFRTGSCISYDVGL